MTATFSSKLLSVEEKPQTKVRHGIRRPPPRAGMKPDEPNRGLVLPLPPPPPSLGLATPTTSPPLFLPHVETNDHTNTNTDSRALRPLLRKGAPRDGNDNINSGTTKKRNCTCKTKGTKQGTNNKPSDRVVVVVVGCSFLSDRLTTGTGTGTLRGRQSHSDLVALLSPTKTKTQTQQKQQQQCTDGEHDGRASERAQNEGAECEGISPTGSCSVSNRSLGFPARGPDSAPRGPPRLVGPYLFLLPHRPLRRVLSRLDRARRTGHRSP